MSRVLITTALEETWPEEPLQPVVFLGEWCRLYDRKSQWSKMKCVVVPYHWDDREKLYYDYRFLRKFHEKLLLVLAKKLNSLHGINYSLRFWRILVGPWLGYFSQMVFDRWFMLKKTIKIFRISGVRVLARSKLAMVPNDMEEWVSPRPGQKEHWFISDDWTEALCGQILERLNIPMERVSKAKAQSIQEPISISRYLRTIGRTWLGSIQGLFASPTEHFFISSSLRPLESIKIQALLGQFPKLWHPLPVPKVNIDPLARNWSLKISPSKFSNENRQFIKIICEIVSQHIPAAYLEGFTDLREAAAHLPWPKKPGLIFDSTLWNSQDLFKFWAAEKIEAGARLIIGQHGGNYGISLWNFNEEHQLAICNKFFSWGWKDPKNKKVHPIGKIAKSKKIRHWNPNGKALLVQMAVPRTSYHLYSIPVGQGQWQKYFEDQQRFVGALSAKMRKQVVIRMYPEDYSLLQKQRWQDRFSDLELEEGVVPMDRLLRKSRLYISTYNATTFLESLSWNIPTIIFWNPKFWEIRSTAVASFKSLASAGIFFSEPESAARQMERIWDHVQEWWEGAEIQKVRKKFCERYADSSKKLVTDVVSFIKNTHPKDSSAQKLQRKKICFTNPILSR